MNCTFQEIAMEIENKKLAEAKKTEPASAKTFGRGKFFSGKRKKNNGIAKCNTSCSGSCK